MSFRADDQGGADSWQFDGRWAALLADALASGTTNLDELPVWLFELYIGGFENGRQSLAETIQDISAERDRYYVLWANPGQEVRAFTERQLDAAAAAYWREFVTSEGGK